MFLTLWNACLFVVVVQPCTVTAYHGSVWRCARYFVITYTAKPRFYNMAKGKQNHIVKSGYRYKRTPDF